jgi:hypothetical protein
MLSQMAQSLWRTKALTVSAKIGLSTLGSGRLSTQWLGNTTTEGGTIVNFDIGTDTTNRHTYIFAGDFTQTSK